MTPLRRDVAAGHDSTLAGGGSTVIARDTRPLEAVGHPVRLRILRRLAESPASVPELADAAAVHENTVRAHVGALEEGGLVSAEARPVEGPGRPTVQYRLTSEGDRLGDDFMGLAELLAAVLGRMGPDASQLREVGQEWGRYLVGRPGRYDIAERLPEVLGRLGFDAEVDGDRVKLRGCPCPLIASDRPELICELATGVLEGALGASGAQQTVGPRDHHPERRRCHVVLVDVLASGRDGRS